MGVVSTVALVQKEVEAMTTSGNDRHGNAGNCLMLDKKVAFRRSFCGIKGSAEQIAIPVWAEFVGIVHQRFALSSSK